MLSNKKKESISLEVIKTLYSNFENYHENSLGEENHPFHNILFNTFTGQSNDANSNNQFFVILKSWQNDLKSTILGQSFFENIAHILSDGQKIIFKDKTNNDFIIDVFFEDDNKVVAIDLKTVNPNAGDMSEEKQKILAAKSVLLRTFPDKEILFFLGFPFDPTSETPTGYDKERFLTSIIDGKKYFEYTEILLADELWNYLSDDDNTMEQILDIINTISTTEFLTKYQYLNNNKNRNEKEYLDILEKWNLCSEIKLIKSNDVIINNISGNKTLTRIYNKCAFDAKGNYNYDRYLQLNNTIEE